MKLGLTIFGYFCITFTVVFGAVSIRYLTLGAADAAQAFIGLAITILSFAFMEFDVIHRWQRFALFHVLFITGIAMVTPFIQSGVPFSTTTSFEVGSFSLLVTGFFITRDRVEYRNILLVSCSATMALFFAGVISAFRDVPGASLPLQPGIGSATTYLVTALFLIGSVDLAVLSALLFALVIREIRSDPRSRLPVS